MKDEPALFVGKGDDGRWFAEHPDFPALTSYGRTKEEAVKSFIHMIELLSKEPS